MIRMQNFNFIIWKFLKISKLLCNVLKISGEENTPNAPPLVARLGTVIVRRVRGKMGKFVVVQRKRKRSSSRERDFCKEIEMTLGRAQSLSVKYSVVTMILVTSLEFPWLMLIDERYCLNAGPLLQVSRFHM